MTKCDANEAIDYALMLFEDAIYRRTQQRFACIANGQAIYSANLLNQIEQLEDFKFALTQLRIPAEQTKGRDE